MRQLVKAAALAGAFLLSTGTTPAGNAIGSDFIVFGYPQSTAVLPHVRWHALTHVATTFVDFDASGNLMNLSAAFTNRHADLKAGGAAQAAGTKVVMLVRNDEFYDGVPSGEPDVINTAMGSSTARTNLVTQIVNAINGDAYCAGVSLDFEFTWGTTTRDNITLFMQELRAALPSDKEISIYTHASYNSNLWNIAAVEPYIDYMLYSTYDWATGSTTHTPSDYNSCLPHINSYMNAGLPPQKLVLVWGSYGRRWTGVTGYNATGSSASSRGFPDGLFATTLDTTFGGPHTANYEIGDETAWHTYNDGTNNYVMVWDSPAAMEMKTRAALSYPGTVNSGRRLRGVGFWSLLWMNKNGNPSTADNYKSFDPITGTEVSRMRTYPHWYQLCAEALAGPGATQTVFAPFEGNDSHWSDPNKSPDEVGDSDDDSAAAVVASPAGTGRPASTTNASRVTFDFEGTGSNRIFYRHEVLNDDKATAVADTNSAVCHVKRNTAFTASCYTPAAYSGYTVRMAVLDADREVEVSPAFSLNTTGWQALTWDLTDGAQIIAYNTNEPNLIDGDGVLDSVAGKKDIKFLGFVIEGSGVITGEVYFDELAYGHRNPGGINYTINELRYSNSATEFVEIKGPAGPFPTGTELRFYNSTTGAVLSSISLAGQSIPASGLFVVGDSGVPNSTSPNGMVPGTWSTGSDNVPNTTPSGAQIYNTVTGNVYDSVVYRAMGGLNNLSRLEANELTGEGYPWLGDTGSGTSASGIAPAFGRYPDGNDTQVNGADFSLMPASPGSANGGTVSQGFSADFSSAPANAFTTFGTFGVTSVATGMPPSPNGGNVHRCADIPGGNVTYFGDAALGSDGNGYTVEGELYIPASADVAQAIGVGFCGSQGSTFFSSSTASSGYDSGYWLIYEHGASTLNDGQAAHAGQFQFVHATNDNMDANPTQALGSLKSLASFTPAVSQGSWVTYRLTVEPSNVRGFQLLAQVNGEDIYRGPLPTGGPVAGAILVGNREFSGTASSGTGTWVDNLQVVAPVPVSLSAFSAE